MDNMCFQGATGVLSDDLQWHENEDTSGRKHRRPSSVSERAQQNVDSELVTLRMTWPFSHCETTVGFFNVLVSFVSRIGVPSDDNKKRYLKAAGR